MICNVRESKIGLKRHFLSSLFQSLKLISHKEQLLKTKQKCHTWDGGGQKSTRKFSRIFRMYPYGGLV